MKLFDIGGRDALPGVISGHPVNGSSQQLTNAAADTDGTVTVKSGYSYLVVPVVTGGVYLGLSDVTTAANVMWACPLGAAVLLHIESGGDAEDVTLHYAVTANDAIAYLIRMEDYE
jgi:hypothetical protein